MIEIITTGRYPIVLTDEQYPKFDAPPKYVKISLLTQTINGVISYQPTGWVRPVVIDNGKPQSSMGRPYKNSGVDLVSAIADAAQQIADAERWLDTYETEKPRAALLQQHWGQPLTRDEYESRCCEWSLEPLPDDELQDAPWGVITWPEYSAGAMARWITSIGRHKVLRQEREEREKAESIARHEENARRLAEMRARPVKRTYTEKRAVWRQFWVKGGELHQVTASKRIGTVDEDMPSYLGSHLLGCEGDALYEITIEVR